MPGVLAGRLDAAGGRPGPVSWDVCQPARDEAGLADMVLLGAIPGFPPAARSAALSMLPGTRAGVKRRGRCINVTIDKR